MFYQPKDGHGLPHDPFKACVVPRPIGWFTSLDRNGELNLAPYSFFNAVADSPPIIMFSATGQHVDGGVKDTPSNIEDTGEFVFNLVTYDLREQMNATSAPLARSQNEADQAGLEMLPSMLVKPPRVAASPVHFECKFLKRVDLPSTRKDGINRVIFGEVVGIHIDDSLISDGLIDIVRAKPVSRLGYMDYAVLENAFSMDRPGR